MNRLEYINTIESQKTQYYKRLIHNNFFTYKGEPYSKTSIKPEVAKAFRKSIKEQLSKSKRRCHRSGINLEIVFQTTKHNPPSVQSLVKNYLDLLHKKLQHIDKIKSILFRDDNQIKYLNVRVHHNILGKDEPLIRIRSYRHGYFIQDLEFAYRILNKDFEDRSNLQYLDFEEEMKENSLDYIQSLNSIWKNYADFIKDKELYITRVGEEAFKSMNLINLQQIQQAYLKINNLTVRDIVTFFYPLISKSNLIRNNDQINKIHEMTSNMILLSFKFVSFLKYPKNDGDSLSIKVALESDLIKFKEKHKILFPLVNPIKLIILYSLPNNIKHEIDPDNLARKHIIPSIQNIFKPPTIIKYWKNLVSQEIPQYSVLGYEVIQIPRDGSTPEEGRISLIVTDGQDYNSLWGKVNDLIQKFIDKI